MLADPAVIVPPILAERPRHRHRDRAEHRNLPVGGPFNFLRVVWAIIYYFVLSLNHDWIHPVLVRFK